MPGHGHALVGPLDLADQLGEVIPRIAHRHHAHVHHYTPHFPPDRRSCSRARRQEVIRLLLAGDADLRKPDMILQVAARMLDFGQPVALMLNGILGHLTDDAEAYTIVNRLMDALPSGSYLALNDGTNVIHGKEFEAAMQVWNQASSAPYCLRSIEQIAHFFDG
ncbi:MAG: SAM-dependent methyltransferase, partial [Pseudonocardiaceae bacterium]